VKDLPIRLKLTLWYTGITCLTFLAAAMAIYFTIRVSVQRNAERELVMRLEGYKGLPPKGRFVFDDRTNFRTSFRNAEV